MAITRETIAALDSAHRELNTAIRENKTWQEKADRWEESMRRAEKRIEELNQRAQREILGIPHPPAEEKGVDCESD